MISDLILTRGGSRLMGGLMNVVPETLTQPLGKDGVRFVTFFWVAVGTFQNVDFDRTVILCVLN